MVIDAVRQFAEDEPIALWGTAPLAVLEPERTRLGEWLALGLHGGLEYLLRAAAARTDPTLQLRAGARGAILLGLPYRREPAPDPGASARRRAGFARGRDYHHVFRGVLRRLAGRLRRVAPGIALRPFCDALPVMEKALAVRAGLGWQGRNTLVVHPQLGSTFVLGGLLLDRDLPGGAACPSRCGACRLCIDACPTGALRLPGVLDAGRCLSRWTTAGLTPPAELRAGSYDFGCDVCQDVCPFNEGPGPEPFAGFYQRTTSAPGSIDTDTSPPSAGGCSSSPSKSV